MDLVFKLVITPLLLLAATLAVRRWGEAIGRLLVGVPLTSGPISVFLALEHGLHLRRRLRQATAGYGRLAAPRWDLPSRMALIAGLVAGVTLIAPYVGPKASGVIASFPFMAIILAIFSHRMIGPTAAQQVLRGMVTGLLTFATFFYLLSLALSRLDMPAAYGGAIHCAFAIQAISLYRMRLPVTFQQSKSLRFV